MSIFSPQLACSVQLMQAASRDEPPQKSVSLHSVFCHGDHRAKVAPHYDVIVLYKYQLVSYNNNYSCYINVNNSYDALYVCFTLAKDDNAPYLNSTMASR